MSLPSRGRGLKYYQRLLSDYGFVVAPFTGAWIEMPAFIKGDILRAVAPFTGAWIEI